jgi:uncharacterized protein (DUF2062 family)
MKLEPRRAARYYYLRFIRLRGHPSVLARGVAVGTFVGITPTIPFHTILALIFAIILRGSKVTALLAAVIVSNPLTFFLQYYFSWKIGNWFTPAEHSWDEVSGLLDAVVNGENYRGAFTVLAEIGLDSLVILIGGGIILATPFTIAFYVLTYMFFRSINKKRLEKHVLD